MSEDLFGSQSPTFHYSSKQATDDRDAKRALTLVNSYCSPPDPWQKAMLMQWLMRQPNGKLAHQTVAASIPRRSGKSWLLEARVFIGLVLFQEQVIVTTHHLATTTELFNRITAYFEDPRFPELQALLKVNGIRRANGQLSIRLTTGAEAKFIARTKSGGRGLKADLLVIDEAQHYGTDAAASLQPVTSAAPRGDSQTIMTGTPEADGGDATVFKAFRARALEGNERRACYDEWSMSDGDDTSDPQVWARANPALGYRLSMDDIQAEQAVMPEYNFAVERLGSWSTQAISSVFDQLEWLSLTDDSSQVETDLVLSVDVNPNRTDASIAVAGLRSDGLYHVEVIEQRTSGVDWVVPRILAIAEKQGIKSVVLDSMGPAGTVAEALLKERKLRVTAMRTVDVVNASAGFYDAVQAQTLRHLSQPGLNKSIAGARKRRIGNDGFGWNRASAAVDLTPLIAATSALWGAKSTKVRKTKSKGDPRSNSKRRIMIH